MNESKLTFTRHVLIGGFIIGAIVIIYFSIIELFNLSGTMYNLFYYGLILVGIIVSTNLYKKEEKDVSLRYGKAVSFGVLQVLLAALFLFAFVLVYYTYVAPSGIEELIATMEQTMIERNTPEETIEQASSLANQYLTPVTMGIMSFIEVMFWGFIMSLIAGLFTRDKSSKSNFEKTMENIGE